MNLGDLEAIRRAFHGVQYVADSMRCDRLDGAFRPTLTVQAWELSGPALSALLDALTAAGASWPDGRVLVSRAGKSSAEVVGLMPVPEAGQESWRLVVWTRADRQYVTEPGRITSRVEV